jgi:CheY-like chemotaxis protein
VLRTLILDDDAARHNAFAKRLSRPGNIVKHAYTFEEAVEAASTWTPQFDVMLLDHDLGTIKTGADFAKYLAEMPVERRPWKIVIHSWNQSGARYMLAVLTEAGYENVTIEMFGVEGV